METPTDVAHGPEPTATEADNDTRRYVVGECVGRGGLGSVHRAWDAHLGRWVAVKRLVADAGSAAADPVLAAERLRREANALAALQHPHIVTVHDFGADVDGPFVVMELIEGETLDAVAGRAPLDAESFATLAVQTLGAVEAAHRAGMLHRDLKPANLMLAPLPDGGFTVKVLDFGLAKFSPRPAAQTIDQANSLLGSIFFMAPEQFHREPLDARTDLYALGAIYFYALTGRHPFDGDSTAQVMAAHLEGRLLRPLARLRPDLPPALTAWVERLMSRIPADRPVSAAAALAQARPFLTGVHIPGGARERTGSVPVLQVSRVSTAATGSTPRTLPGWLAPALGIALLLGAGGFFAYRTGRPSSSPSSSLPAPSRLVAPAVAAVPVSTQRSAVPAPAQASPPAPAAPTPAASPTAVAEEVTLEASDVTALRERMGQTLTVTGTPSGVGQSRSGNVFYLNFGSRPREGLAVVYFASPGSAVSQDSFRPFVGKPVRVRGKVNDFKGELQVVIQALGDVQPVP